MDTQRMLFQVEPMLEVIVIADRTFHEGRLAEVSVKKRPN